MSTSHRSSRAACPVIALEFASRASNDLVPLGLGSHSIGSSPSSDIVVEGDEALPLHGHITVGPQGVSFFRASPGAKTFLGARAVRSSVLAAGSVLHVGDDVLVVHHLAPGEDLTIPAIAGLRGRSSAMRALARSVSLFADLDVPVLIHGPSGTGKDAVAAAIHGGVSAARPFVIANVASIPRELCESELFGHARGSFTGADREHQGLLTQADGGTLFLDEIGELPIDVQPKLLRALDGYGFRAIGGRTLLRPGVRIVTASHVDLRQAVREGVFRNDLLHRLEVLVVETPSLAARRTDIAAIALGIVAAEASRMRQVRIAPAALAALMGMRWDGNVRELRNVLLRASALAPGAELHAEDVRAAGMRQERAFEPELTAERAVELLYAAGGNITRAATSARVARTTFRRRIAEAHRTLEVPPWQLNAQSVDAISKTVFSLTEDRDQAPRGSSPRRKRRSEVPENSEGLLAAE